MLDRLIRNMSRNKGGLVLLTGAAALLSGVERMMSTRKFVPLQQETGPTLTPEDRFRIYRSKTELGFSYWVLQGTGAFDGFALFDTWAQAMQEAERRIAVARRIVVPRARDLVPVAY